MVSTERRLRIGILDSSAFNRSGIRALLEQNGFSACDIYCFAELNALTTCLDERGLSVVLLTDQVPAGDDPLSALARLHQCYPGTHLVILSERLEVTYIRQLFDAGIRGFVYRGGRLEDTLIDCITTVGQGEVYLSPQAAVLPFTCVLPPEGLTERDVEVLRFLAQGMVVQDIARRLHLRRKTIYRIRARLRQYLNASTNEQLIHTAIQQGWIESSP